MPDQNLNFSGETTENNYWIGSNQSPLTIEAPLFLQGGLVDVNITILSIDSIPVSGNETIFQILFTMGEFIPFSTEIDNTIHDLMFATYFDKIEDFSYDSKNKKITAQMLGKTRLMGYDPHFSFSSTENLTLFGILMFTL